MDSCKSLGLNSIPQLWGAVVSVRYLDHGAHAVILGIIQTLSLSVHVLVFGIWNHVETGNFMIKQIHAQLRQTYLSCSPNSHWFPHEERRTKKKNQRHQGTEIVRRSVVKIKTLTMNLQSLVRFMPWHLLEQIWGNRPHDSHVSYSHPVLNLS